MPDQTVYEFDDHGRLVRMTDRNQIETTYSYSADQLVSIVDHTGLATTFKYLDGRVAKITDPAGRETRMEYDADGNLIRIIDPDVTSRQFTYDGRHHLVKEIDKRGNSEQARYGRYGRLVGAIRKDGSVVHLRPFETSRLSDHATTSDWAGGASVLLGETPIVSSFVDGRGNITVSDLDRAGQHVRARDALGRLPTIERNQNNLVSSIIDARGSVQEFKYDGRGNVTATVDEIVRASGSQSVPFSPQSFALSTSVSNERFTILVAADVNADGNMDVVAANPSAERVSVLLGNGVGGFGSTQSYSLVDDPPIPGRTQTSLDMAVVDINGDGILDLIVASTGSIQTLMGLGDGTFSPSEKILESGAQMEVADIDGDSVLDIVLLARSDVGVAFYTYLRGQGDGSYSTEVLWRNMLFTIPAGNMEATDFNGDGLADLLFSGGNVLIGDGTGQFTRVATGNEDSSDMVAAGDVNADGTTDIITTSSSSGDTFVILGNGDATFQSKVLVGNVPGSHAAEIADVTGDGALDLVILHGTDPIDAGVSVFRGQAGGFAPAPVYSSAPVNRWTNLAIADYDSDDVVDLVTAFGVFSNRARADVVSYAGLLTGDGEGGFGRQKTQPVNSGGSGDMVFEDFNHDGIVDVAGIFGRSTSNYAEGFIQVALGFGDGSFGPPTTYTVAWNPREILVGDYNGDGIIDIATVHDQRIARRPDLSVLFGQGENGQGNGQFSPAIGFTASQNALLHSHSFGQADFDHDGDLDFAMATPSGNWEVKGTWLFRNDGEGDFTPTRISTPGSSQIAVSDVNGDGHADVVGTTGTSAWVALGNGDATFTDPESYSLPITATEIALVDVNLDGAVDLAIVSSEEDRVAILLGNGVGGFGVATTYDTRKDLLDIELRDVTADGIPDLVTVHATRFGHPGRYYGNISVLVGIGDGTFAEAALLSAGANGHFRVGIADLNNDGQLDIVSHSWGALVTLLGQEKLNDVKAARPRLYSYDPVFNQLVNTYDELGRRTIYELDPANGNRLSETRVVGQLDSDANGETDDVVTTATYTTLGQIDRATDPLGRVTDFDYDALGRLIKTTFAAGTPDEAFQSFEYDAAGNQTAVVDENGNRTEFEYDVLNRLTRITQADPDGTGPLTSPVTTMEYDANGNVTRITDGEGSITINEFDAKNRLIQVRRVKGLLDPESQETDDSITSFQYDMDGNRIAEIDPNGNVTRKEYDLRNRPTRFTDPDGGVTQFAYSADDNLLRLVDPNGNTSRFFYDARNRLTREQDPLGESSVFEYDVVDNLVRKTDRNERVTEFAYDELNRLTAEVWTNVDETAANQVVYSYDKASNLAAIHDNFSGLAFTYDARDRLRTTDNAGTPDAPNVVLAYTYDDVGNVLALAETIDGESGAVTNYEYDLINRMKAVGQTGGLAEKRVEFAYNQVGLFSSIDRFSDTAGQNLGVLAARVHEAGWAIVLA